MPDPILVSVYAVTYSSSLSIGGSKFGGLSMPLILQQKEITRDAEYEPDIHGHAFEDI